MPYLKISGNPPSQCPDKDHFADKRILAQSWKQKEQGDYGNRNDHARIESPRIGQTKMHQGMQSAQSAASRTLQSGQHMKRAARIATRRFRIEEKQETCTQNRSQNAADQKCMPLIERLHALAPERYGIDDCNAV